MYISRLRVIFLTLRRNTSILITERVARSVRVKVHLGVLVPELNGVVVVHRDTVLSQEVVGQGLLELRRHEIIARTALVQNAEVHLEPEEVEEQRDHNETDEARNKVLSELLDGQALADVQQIPQIDGNRRTDGEEGEDTDVLGGDGAGQGNTGQKQPLPPLPRERGIAELGELHVAEQRQSQGEDQGSVKQNESGLADVRVVEKHEHGRAERSGQAVAALPHDLEDHGNREGTLDGRDGAEGNPRDLVLDVGVTDVLELEVTIVANEPADERDEELAEGRVDVEEVGPFKVLVLSVSGVQRAGSDRGRRT